MKFSSFEPSIYQRILFLKIMVSTKIWSIFNIDNNKKIKCFLSSKMIMLKIPSQILKDI